MSSPASKVRGGAQKYGMQAEPAARIFLFANGSKHGEPTRLVMSLTRYKKLQHLVRVRSEAP